MASTSIIRSLLETGELDRLSITLCPELPGGGTRLFGDGPAGSSLGYEFMSLMHGARTRSMSHSHC